MTVVMFFGTDAYAWSSLGHQLVGQVAQGLLTPQAKAGVAELLRDEPDPTLAGVAMWADTLRTTDPERFKATAPWHYVNMPLGTCRFIEARDCPNGACVIGAINTHFRLLTDRTQPFEVRRDALKFIVHFVGDIHQPLHTSNRPDRGGNDFPITLRTDIAPEEYAREHYVDGVMETNLHSVWDYYVLASAGLEMKTYAERLQTKARSPIRFHGSPRAWAAESCRLIDRRTLYPSAQEMNAEYLNAMRPLAEQRVEQAARRLAGLLNAAFAHPPSSTLKR
jgi:hypothetical protein